MFNYEQMCFTFKRMSKTCFPENNYKQMFLETIFCVYSIKTCLNTRNNMFSLKKFFKNKSFPVNYTSTSIFKRFLNFF